MAYCRFSDTCKVYMYSSVTGGYQFHLSWEPPFGGDQDFVVQTTQEALRKMRRLQSAGHGVPQYAIDRLERELIEERKNDRTGTIETRSKRIARASRKA